MSAVAAITPTTTPQTNLPPAARGLRRPPAVGLVTAQTRPTAADSGLIPHLSSNCVKSKFDLIQGASLREVVTQLIPQSIEEEGLY